MGPDAILVQNTLSADSNLDHAVDFKDLVVLAQNYGTIGTYFSQGDFNFDLSVGFSDLVILAQNYGTSATALLAAVDFTAPIQVPVKSAASKKTKEPILSVAPLAKPVSRPVKGAKSKSRG